MYTLVLILTDKFDIHADIVIEKIASQGVHFFRLDLDVESLLNTSVTFKDSLWRISNKEFEVNSNRVSCVWCRRPFVELTLEEQQISEIDFKIWKNEWNKTLLGLYNSLKHVPWLNPLRKAYKGENKYYQMQLAKEIGFILPETIVSNDKDELASFVRTHNGALLKLMSQEIYTVSENDFRGFYTNLISEDDIMVFGGRNENPVVLQKYIDKQYEVRYTVVGKHHFACRIDSQSSEYAKFDWRRYDIPHTPHTAIDPPIEIKEKVSLFMNQLQLEFGAIDFIVTPENEWVFLEINCMGQWLWIEQLTNLPISGAIAEWIINHAKKI